MSAALTTGPKPTVDLPALLSGADAASSAVERNLWLVGLFHWLRHEGPLQEPDAAAPGTPWPVRRLRHLLDVLDRHPDHRERVSGLLRSSFSELDATGLLADFGFSSRQSFLSELGERLRLRWLPGTPETQDLGEAFSLMLAPQDAVWIAALDQTTLERLLSLWQLEGPPAQPWQAPMIESIQLLASQMRASGLSSAMRRRMDPALLAARPFHQVVQAAEALRQAELSGGSSGGTLGRTSSDGQQPLVQAVSYLRAVLAACDEAALSLRAHLDEYGISVDLVFQIEQMRQRGDRIELLLDGLLAAHPALELRRMVLEVLRTSAERRGIGSLFARHYGLLARKVTERSAHTGEHYITRNRAEYQDMLRKAAGGGAIIGFTTLAKFALLALPLSVFLAGLAAGLNYALSFVIVHLLHWTVATKQPAMTAPSLAAKLEGVASSDEALEAFVDDVAHLFRSQMAGILGNLALVVPVVLACQGLAWGLFGAPLIDTDQAHHVLHSLHWSGPTLIFAAFTGVLLFGSSLIAGWVENWFVFHRLDSAIAWNPRLRGALGASRAQRWSRWWRANISGLAANVSLGLLLGLVPALGTFFGLPLEVRHITLSMGQLAAALGTLGPSLLQDGDFWRCVAVIPLVGLLNVGVSFFLAYRVALASRGIRKLDRSRILRALRQRCRQAPLSFLWPPREAD